MAINETHSITTHVFMMSTFQERYNFYKLGLPLPRYQVRHPDEGITFSNPYVLPNQKKLIEKVSVSKKHNGQQYKEAYYVNFYTAIIISTTLGHGIPLI